MPRNKYPERTEQAILETAKRLFLERGCESVTLQDIAAACGVTRGAIYHHFKGKEELLDGVTTYLFQETVPWEEICSEAGGSGLEKLRRLIGASASNKEQLQMYLMLAPIFYRSPKLAAAYLDSIRTQAVPLLRELLAEGMEDGSVPQGDPNALAEVVAGCTSIILSPLIFPGGEKSFRAKVQAVQTMLEGMGLPLIDGETAAAFQRLGAMFDRDQK